MNQEYLGTGWSFPPEFSRVTGDVHMSSGPRDVAESLRILVGTLPGERAMRPDFGAAFQDLLFAGMDTTTQTEFFDRIRIALLQYEPRILVEKLALDTAFLTEGRVELVVDYRIRANNTRHNFVYPFYLEEGSLIEQI
ncbi:GPW/gp25 family protein [Lewinella sp. JB7]|uniref:GPW/gp25 family protein n=1 Tax=Lewinella sp. JB7 TaxID=2962887 RepID=UPI0020C9AAB9|nr:GPW/gp25 family protein [Lewinella sp. JB7]MCP9234655.1 GPW/gp25 family protein [Lewinella sp. JB7]